MKKLTSAELDALVAEATVHAYDEYEQARCLRRGHQRPIAMPFQATILGATVTVTTIESRPGSQITTLSTRGQYRQATGILDPPPPAPLPEGWEWVEAYRHWAP
ncbi:hypothetical protein ACWGCW_26500 [Streptomyces sp. NPDC054933]